MQRLVQPLLANICPLMLRLWCSTLASRRMRYREFVVYKEGLIEPLYLVAYKRDANAT